MVVDTIVGSTVSVGMLVLVIMEAMDIMVDIMVDMEVVTMVGVTGATVEAPQGAGQFHDLGQVQYQEAQAGATVRAGATTTGPKTSSTIPMAVATP